MVGEGLPLRITVLGSGTSTGVPVIGCECAVCQSTEPRNQRQRSSLLVTRRDTGEHVVIDTTPDFRSQVLAAKVKRLNHVLYTHTHADHCHGFDDLRAFYFHSKQAVHCYLRPDDARDLQTRFSYAFEDTGYQGTVPQVHMHAIPEAEPFEVLGMQVEALSLPHGSTTSAAFRIGQFAYATDFKNFPPAAIEHWRGKVKTMVASGLRFREHGTHSSVQETIALFAQLGVEYGVLTHLSHEVDFQRDSKKLPPHVAFAYDGMAFEVNA